MYFLAVISSIITNVEVHRYNRSIKLFARSQQQFVFERQSLTYYLPFYYQTRRFVLIQYELDYLGRIKFLHVEMPYYPLSLPHMLGLYSQLVSQQNDLKKHVKQSVKFNNWRHIYTKEKSNMKLVQSNLIWIVKSNYSSRLIWHQTESFGDKSTRKVQPDSKA